MMFILDLILRIGTQLSDGIFWGMVIYLAVNAALEKHRNSEKQGHLKI